ncbi:MULTISPECIES: hypothetical protein [Sandaracinus]|uniref:hypothetical protein n=1 Tax=Sandaracinus TaxID=1055688 RepID=UPI0019D496FA|nr:MULTISPECIES: hypothetical protein [Sandaracinus]QRN75745.1 Hypothetical protein MSR10575_88320 [Sandaracinus sp.]UJR87239.1 Hypothetical protein I5071_310 [Sandaracinus amylolyticus]
MQRRAHALESGLAIDWLSWRPGGDRRVARVVGETEGSFDAAHVPRIDIGRDGADAVLLPLRSALTLQGRTLHVASDNDAHRSEGPVSIVLAEAHRERNLGEPVVLAWPPTGRNFLVLTVERYEGIHYRGDARAALSRVDLQTATTTLVATGRGSGALAISPDGAVYAQLGERTLRIGDGDVVEELPAGLVLVAGTPRALDETVVRELLSLPTD